MSLDDPVSESVCVCDMKTHENSAPHLAHRVEEAYHRIEGPPCVTVDASPSQDQVLQQVLLLIRDKCHL